MSTRKKEFGFTLIEIMIVVAIISLLATITIPTLLRAKKLSNDALAKNTLLAMSQAAESYKNHNGQYPTTEAALTSTTPPLLNQSYCTNTPIAGYIYNCSGMSATGYTITATPVSVGSSGSTTYTITTGGALTP